MQTKEIPFDKYQHYPHRTCGYKNRKKHVKMISKAIIYGSYGQFSGFCLFESGEEIKIGQMVKFVDKKIYKA